MILGAVYILNYIFCNFQGHPSRLTGRKFQHTYEAIPMQWPGQIKLLFKKFNDTIREAVQVLTVLYFLCQDFLKYWNITGYCHPGVICKIIHLLSATINIFKQAWFDSQLSKIWLFIDFRSSLRTGSCSHHCGHNYLVGVLQTLLIEIKNTNVS